MNYCSDYSEAEEEEVYNDYFNIDDCYDNFDNIDDYYDFQQTKLEEAYLDGLYVPEDW